MAAKTWDNGGGDGLWSTGANWSDNAVPATTDTLTFDGTSSADCTIDNVGTWSGGSISVTGAYGGNFIQNVAMTIGGTLTLGTAPASNTWTMNAALNGNFTVSIGAQGTFTRTTGDALASFSINATGILNLGANARVNLISTNSGSTITGTGAITFVTGTTNLVNGTVWDTSGVTSVLCQGSGVAAHALTIGTAETSLQGVPITVTGAGNFTFTGAAYDFNVVAITTSGSGSVIVAATATIDLGASPTTTCNGMTINGVVKVSGTWNQVQLSTASPVVWNVGAGATVSGALTAVNVTGSLTINATGTFPASVVLNLNPNQNTTVTITSTVVTFGTCTLTGSTGVALTIAANTSITLAANQTGGFTGTFTVTGTLNLLGNLTLACPFTTSASSVLSGTGIIKLTDQTWTMNATCTVSNTIGVIMNFAGASGRTFAGAGKTYASFQRTGTGSATLTISGSNTFVGAFTDNDGQVAHSILFTASTTQTAAAWNLKGSTGKILTINSTTATNFVLTTTGGVNIVCSFINVANSTVDAAPVWYAGLTPPSVDGGGGNVNWIFTPPPNSALFRQTAQVVM